MPPCTHAGFLASKVAGTATGTATHSSPMFSSTAWGNISRKRKRPALWTGKPATACPRVHAKCFSETPSTQSRCFFEQYPSKTIAATIHPSAPSIPLVCVTNGTDIERSNTRQGRTGGHSANTLAEPARFVCYPTSRRATKAPLFMPIERARTEELGTASTCTLGEPIPSHTLAYPL